MKKLLLLSILLPISLICMESGNFDIPKEDGEVVEQKQLQIIPGLPNDVSKQIIAETLTADAPEPSKKYSRNAITNFFKKYALSDKSKFNALEKVTEEENSDAIVKAFNTRASLLRVSKAFLAQKELIDAQTIKTLQQIDPKWRTIFFQKLIDKRKNIKDRLIFGNLLSKSGFKIEDHYLEEQIANTVYEAMKKDDTRWFETILNSGLDINYTETNKQGNTEFLLQTALRLHEKNPKGALKVVKLLLDKGANPSIKIKVVNRIESVYSHDDIYDEGSILEIYGPKRLHKDKKYSSFEAEEIKKLLYKAEKKFKNKK